MRIWLVGYYGFGNWGDELSLIAVSRELADWARQYRIPLTLSVLSRNQHLPAGLPPGTTPVPRQPLRAIRRELRACDGVVVGGGSLLQDTSSLRSLLYYWMVLGGVLRRKKPVVFFRCGLGPFHRRLSRWLAGRLMQRVSLFVSRDEASARMARELGCPAERVWEGRDPVYGLFEPGIKRSVSSGPVAVFVRSFPPAFRPVFREALIRLQAETGGRVECSGFHQEIDREIVDWLGQETGCQTRYFQEREEVEAYFPEIDCLFTMRLHPAIIASRLGIPWYAFDIDPKIRALASWLESDTLFQWNDFGPETLVEAYRNQATNRQRARGMTQIIEQTIRDESSLGKPVFRVLTGKQP